MAPLCRFSFCLDVSGQTYFTLVILEKDSLLLSLIPRTSNTDTLVSISGPKLTQKMAGTLLHLIFGNEASIFYITVN